MYSGKVLRKVPAKASRLCRPVDAVLRCQYRPCERHANHGRAHTQRHDSQHEPEDVTWG